MTRNLIVPACIISAAALSATFLLHSLPRPVPVRPPLAKVSWTGNPGLSAHDNKCMDGLAALSSTYDWSSADWNRIVVLAVNSDGVANDYVRTSAIYTIAEHVRLTNDFREKMRAREQATGAANAAMGDHTHRQNNLIDNTSRLPVLDIDGLPVVEEVSSFVRCAGMHLAHQLGLPIPAALDTDESGMVRKEAAIYRNRRIEP